MLCMYIGFLCFLKCYFPYLSLFSASVKNLLSHAKDNELVEEIITDLIVHLAKRLCSPSEHDGTHIEL